MKNNLFYYATSELSQDAFICWLVSFALPESKKDNKLKECAKDFICLLNPDIDKGSLILEKIEKQATVKEGSIVDILLTLTSNSKHYKIIIEDKIYADSHGNQLVRYLKDVKEKYPEYIVKGAFYKTGFPGDLSSVRDVGYTIITREMMLKLMEKYIKDTSNDIFKDYYCFWKQFQEKSQEYKSLPVNKWDWWQLYGFYDYVNKSEFLKANKFGSNYSYVPNPSGGFFALWISSDPSKSSKMTKENIPYELYLQMETAWNYQNDCYDIKICLKQGITDMDKMKKQKVSYRNMRDAVMYYSDWSSRIEKYNFVKPSRLGSGVHMTVGVYKSSYNDAESLFDSIKNAVNDYIKILDEL